MLEPVPFRNALTKDEQQRTQMMQHDWVRWCILLRDAVNGWHPESMADADAQPNSIFYSTDGSALSYKDPAGVVHALY